MVAEGCILHAYQDSLGFWTIGYGHLLHPQSKDWTNYTITQAQADDLLSKDIDIARNYAETLPEWGCLDTLCRQNAIIELVFNMGLVKWRQFVKCRADISDQDWQGAHDELLNSQWAVQVGAGRSQRLATYLLKGSYLS